jgi:hypothetical protein
MLGALQLKRRPSVPQFLNGGTTLTCGSSEMLVLAEACAGAGRISTMRLQRRGYNWGAAVIRAELRGDPRVDCAPRKMDNRHKQSWSAAALEKTDYRRKWLC